MLVLVLYVAMVLVVISIWKEVYQIVLLVRDGPAACELLSSTDRERVTFD